jgi:hypothetical protein
VTQQNDEQFDSPQPAPRGHVFTLTGVTSADNVAADVLQVYAEDVSDGYHTMHELYEHRMALNAALFNFLAVGSRTIEVMKAKFHHDGTMFEGGYFVVMAIFPNVGQVSYHYKLKHWDKFKIPEVRRTPPWDGHNAGNSIERLLAL